MYIYMDFINFLFSKPRYLSHDEMNQMAINDIKLHNACWITTYSITYCNKETER